MATIINNPDSGGGNGGGGMGMIIGAIVLVLVLVLLFVYGIPALRNSSNSGGTEVNIPDKVDVNVDTPSNN